MAESRTDARLDDLNRRGDERGRCMDEGFTSLRSEMNVLRSGMNARFERQESRFDAAQRLTIQLWAGTMFALLAGFATLLAAQF